MNMNIYNPYVRSELELYHHGIAGQKWGKRNGPPYPLSASAHSASEKKAGWRKSLSDHGDDRKYTKAVKKEIKLLKKEHKILRKEGQSDNWHKALNKTLDQEDKRHALEDKIGRERADKVNDKLRAKRDRSIKAAIKKKIDSITPEQKAKALKIAGVVALTAAAAYGGYVGIKYLNGRALTKLAKSYAENNALATKRHNAETHYLADYVGRTGRQRLLDMADRHPGSRTARKAVNATWNQVMKNHDVTAGIRRSADIAGNKLSFYQDPKVRLGKKLVSQLSGRRVY